MVKQFCIIASLFLVPFFSYGKEKMVSMELKNPLCVSCPPDIRHGFKKTAGVESIGFVMKKKIIVIAFDDDVVTLKDIKKKLKNLGFPIIAKTETFIDDPKKNPAAKNQRKLS